MEWLDRMNDVLTYLEANLDGEIDLEQAAQLAACSQFHFQRMFTYIAGVPLSEYLRRRRMTLAALELAGGNVKVIDLALRYGYDSPTAFNRAFQNVHGVPPSRAREGGVRLTAYPRISFTLTVKGETSMNYRIETLKAFRIVGLKVTMPMDVEQSFAQVPRFWQQSVPRIPELMPLMNGTPKGLLGVSACMKGETFDYFIAVASDADVPQGMAESTVPACTWAIFDCTGPMPDALQTLQKRIVTEWLPTSGYEYANAPDIEVYFEGDQFSPDYRCEAWLPIRKTT